MRDSTVHRRTKETDVTVTLELDFLLSVFEFELDCKQLILLVFS